MPPPFFPKPLDDKLGKWPVYLNTEGKYGVASALARWSTLGSLLQCIAYKMCGIWYIFRYAGDNLLLSRNIRETKLTRPILRFCMFCNIAGVPLKSEKTRGGSFVITSATTSTAANRLKASRIAGRLGCPTGA